MKTPVLCVGTWEQATNTMPFVFQKATPKTVQAQSTTYASSNVQKAQLTGQQVIRGSPQMLAKILGQTQQQPTFSVLPKKGKFTGSFPVLNKQRCFFFISIFVINLTIADIIWYAETCIKTVL